MIGQMSIFEIMDPEGDLREALKYGGLFGGSKLRVYALYEMEPDRKKREDFLRAEFQGGGRTINFTQERRGFVDYSKTGIRLSYFGERSEKKHSWKEGERITGELIRAREYLTEKDRDEWNALLREHGGKIPYPIPARRFPEPKKTCSSCEHFKPTYVHGGGTGYPVCFVGDPITRSNDPEQEACEDYEERIGNDGFDDTDEAQDIRK